MKLKLLSVEDGKIKINKSAAGIIYEEKKYESHSFKAEIFKDYIKCTRIYGKKPESFFIKNNEKMIRTENMADDFATFLFDKDKALEWYYKKKHFTKRRF